MGLGSMCARLSGALTPLITLLGMRDISKFYYSHFNNEIYFITDSFDPTVPAIIFGIVALASGFWVMFLPETMDQPMPQSLEDGENFGIGDTLFTTGLGRKSKVSDRNNRMVPLNTLEKS